MRNRERNVALAAQPKLRPTGRVLNFAVTNGGTGYLDDKPPLVSVTAPYNQNSEGARLGATGVMPAQHRNYTLASTCFNGQEYERVEFRKNCACAEEDYECDFGYERSSDNGPCVAIMAISNAAPKDCSGFYTVSNGYRLVAGDTCDPTKGIDHLPTVNRCPGLFAGAASVSSSCGAKARLSRILRSAWSAKFWSTGRPWSAPRPRLAARAPACGGGWHTP